MHELVRTKNNGGKQPKAMFKHYFQVPFDWAFSGDMVHWQEYCYCDDHYSIYRLLDYESLGGQTVPKAQCSWVLTVKFKGQQSGVGTMAKTQSFEMKRKVNSQEITAKCVLLSSTDHVAWEKKSEWQCQHDPRPLLQQLSSLRTQTRALFRFTYPSHSSLAPCLVQNRYSSMTFRVCQLENKI